MESKYKNRWDGIVRPFTQNEVRKARGRFQVEHSLARQGAEKFFGLTQECEYVAALSAVTGSQAVRQVQGGQQVIYLSGWQTAYDANSDAQTYPDQSLYSVDSVPKNVKRINNALHRMDQICFREGKTDTDWQAPIVADAEAGFGGPRNAAALMSAMIEAGAAAVHFEDQLGSEKKCGHLGGKVLVPTNRAIDMLVAARFAADVMNVPTVLIARTDANVADGPNGEPKLLLANDIDPSDHQFITGDRTREGYYRIHGGMKCAIERSLAFAPYADQLWFETSKPSMKEAEEFADAIHAKFPGKVLAYNLSPSFNWRKNLSNKEIAEFMPRLGALGYRYQFITLSGMHSMNAAMFELAHNFSRVGMPAYVEIQEREFAMADIGYTGALHQRDAATGWFDDLELAVTQGGSSSVALGDSTEAEQFGQKH